MGEMPGAICKIFASFGNAVKADLKLGIFCGALNAERGPHENDLTITFKNICIITSKSSCTQ